MKTMVSSVLILGWLMLAGQVYGQGNRDKLRNDPTYSTHNYKHANKAAVARKWEGASGVAVAQPSPGQAGLANYKRQAPNQAPVGGVTVGHTPSASVAERNYKIQRPNQSISLPGSGVANTRKDRADKAATTGD